MTDKIQKIKDWISKEQDGLMDAQGNFEYSEHEGAYHILCNLDTYIDSMQEESVSIWHDMSEEAENGRNIIIIDPKDFYGAVLRKGGSQLRNHNKERYVRWAYIDDIINVTNKEEPVSEQNLSNVERTGKNWKEPVSEELDSFAIKYAQDKPYPVTVCQAVKVGANWQKEQIMKDAVKGGCFSYKNGYKHISCDIDEKLTDIEFGDKIKVIVIKED